MKKEGLRIADNSRLPVITAVCAAFILFFEFCTVNIVGGKFMFTFRVPLYFGEGRSLIDLVESSVVVCIPVLMLVFTLLYAKKNIRMLCWPPAFFVLRFLIKTGYLWVYEGHFSLEDTWLDLAVSLLLLSVFTLTVFGKIKTRRWLVGISGIFIIMEMTKLFVPGYTLVIGTSVYFSTFLSPVLFFAGYGVLGLAMKEF